MIATPQQKMEIKLTLKEIEDNCPKKKAMYGYFVEQLRIRGYPKIAERSQKRYIKEMRKGIFNNVRHKTPTKEFIGQIEEESKYLNWTTMDDLVNHLNKNHDHMLKKTNTSYLKHFKNCKIEKKAIKKQKSNKQNPKKITKEEQKEIQQQINSQILKNQQQSNNQGIENYSNQYDDNYVTLQNSNGNHLINQQKKIDVGFMQQQESEEQLDNQQQNQQQSGQTQQQENTSNFENQHQINQYEIADSYLTITQ